MDPRYQLSRRSRWLKHNQWRSLFFFSVQFGRTFDLFETALNDGLRVSSSINPDFQHELWIRLFMIHHKSRPARP
jgi:hypothetical protein